jgi:mannose-6-phosphate isomerase-like protein (cupin superfamily)
MSVSTGLQARVVASTAAPAYAFLGNLVKVQISGEQTGGAYSLTEHLAPAGFGPPPHIHHREDEGFYVIEGELTVWCADDTYLVRPGDFAFLPRGVVHTFKNTGATTARILVLTSPGGFEDFVAEVGTPVPSGCTDLTLPAPPTEAEIGHMLSVCPKYGIEMLLDPAADN